MIISEEYFFYLEDVYKRDLIYFILNTNIYCANNIQKQENVSIYDIDYYLQYLCKKLINDCEGNRIGLISYSGKVFTLVLIIDATTLIEISSFYIGSFRGTYFIGTYFNFSDAPEYANDYERMLDYQIDLVLQHDVYKHKKLQSILHDKHCIV